MANNRIRTDNIKSSTSSGSVNKLVIVVASAAVVVIAVLVGVIVVLLNKPTESEQKGTVASGTRATMVSEPEDVAAFLNSELPPEAYYTASMNYDWHFQDSASASTDAYVENDSSNQFTVYFDLFLDSDSSLVYSSPYIPVGETLTGITLTESLDPGDYPATCTYHLVDENNEELSTVSVGLTLHIAN
ncbi:MAG: hypothetical protein K6B41_03570 [Butyrivibrio sp.]|nr:hypothetical protein [Butyrivibrio sp.]